MSACTEQHVLAASFDVHVAFRVDDGHVARVQPTVGVEYLFRGFLVFIVAQHGVASAAYQFAGNPCRVGTQHFQFHAFGRPSARHISRFVPRAVADDGAAFRHAVGDGIGEIDGTHERFHLGVERCAADDDFLDVPPEKAQAFRACLFLDLFADDGDVQKQLAQFAVDFRKDFFLEYLFDDQWHARHDAGMKLCHGGHDDLGRRHAREEI